jgi:hypothetical protein
MAGMYQESSLGAFVVLYEVSSIETYSLNEINSCYG